MVRSLFFFTVLCIFFTTRCVEYVYPVAQLADERICVIYQKNAAHVELWLWDASTGTAVPGLFTRYTPGGLRVLPNGNDVSFIDHGLIKIKYANNSVPHILELNKPLSNITILHWIDNYKCYTHAKQGNNSGIFTISNEGKTETIIQQDDHDFLYPQKIGSDFYYIEKYKNTRCFKSQYRIMKVSENKDNEVVLDFGSHAIAFLIIFSDSEGFVIEHPQSIKEKKKVVPFVYHYLFKENNKWKEKELFNFTIPSQLLFGADRLYESLLPLLPRKIGNSIYFVSQTEPDSLSLYSYDLVTHVVQQIITQKPNEYFFVPIQTTCGIYCGGRLQHAPPGGVEMELVKGQCCIQLREIEVFT